MSEDTVGSFSCSCLPGFTGDGQTCNDVDECSLGTDNCAENATCTDTVGSFSCSCLPFFTGDGITCVDTRTCPGGPPGSEFWVKSSDGTKCFQFFSDQLDYAGAKAQCVTNVTGSTLAIILSESQNSDVEGLIPDVTTSVKNWIGLEQSTPGTWAWLDSTSTAGYINWDGNNGGTAPSNADKACGAINNKQIKKWKEQTCSEPGQYICEVILP
ncbi:adhesion G protein-coupled receptor E2-like [Lingula anatina]|uniref:Adhesion G protein-coupled receptor E2-like n=1 Tax=Lingula anatina TaxID=7574 RepID=A0A2R2MRI0_LINAN|nr:adhesion G protein-coupled receptor E2-like [Lingula anatina]|eukprot:XP_023932855.1 adhesion G protein-coupled receptor E2-like [Lingula anatina]